MLNSPRTDFESLGIPQCHLNSVSPTVTSPDRLADGLSNNVPLSGLPYEHMNFNVGQSLPDLAGELVVAQCSQTAEVDQREETMLKIQTELQEGRY